MASAVTQPATFLTRGVDLAAPSAPLAESAQTSDRETASPLRAMRDLPTISSSYAGRRQHSPPGL